jgi:hypothetical protein
MIIRGYAGMPLTFAPDIGEVILARRTPVDPWVKAVVIRARRNSAKNLRLTVIWMEDDPHAGAEWRGHATKPIRAGQFGWIELRRGPGVPPLIKQIPKGTPTTD